MKRKMIPDTDSIRELAAFWDTHDVTDFEDQMEEVREPVFQRHGRNITISFGHVSVPVEAFSIQNTRHGNSTDADADLEVECFVPADKLLPPVLSSCVHLGPAKDGDKAYQLFLEAMKAERCRAVLRSQSHGRKRIFLLRLIENTMILERLETLHAAFVERDRGAAEPKRPEIDLARQLIKQLGVKTYDLEKGSLAIAEKITIARRQASKVRVIRLDEWIAKCKARA
jgi:hypothetical protein